MTADPLDALRQPVPPAPVMPRPEFVSSLRERVVAALSGAPAPTGSGSGSNPDRTNLDDRTPAMPDVLTTTVSITPYLSCADAGAAITFYEQAFGAVEEMRLAEPNGRIGHAEISIGGARIQLSDEYPEIGVLSPTTLGGTPFSLTLEVPNCDEVFAQAVAAGATVLREVADQFYGYRSGQVLDPSGHRWSIQTKLEDLSADEMAHRLSELDQS